MVNFSLNVRLDSGPPRIQYQLWTAYSSPSFHFFFRCLLSPFLFLLFFVARRPAIYTRATGEKREIYNNKAPGITGTSVPRRPVVGCNRWRHKPMSTRNLEFLTPSRWLATTRGSRHLIVPTATNVPLISLIVSFSLSLSLSRAHTGIVSFFSYTFVSRRVLPFSSSLPPLPVSERGPIRVQPAWRIHQSTMLFYKLPCVAIVARAGLVRSVVGSLSDQIGQYTPG